jgi:hypothetical protein
MGVAIDTILGKATDPGSTYTAITAATGTPLQVRNFSPSDWATLEMIVRRGASNGAVRIRSPLLADDVQGIKFLTSESPSAWVIPPDYAQKVQAGDTLTVEVTGGTAETDVAAYSIYYANLPGASARLHMPGDIVGNVANIKPLTVAVTNSATIGTWTDTLITTGDKLVKAGKTYAVLGYLTTAALAVVGVRGSELNNFRVCGPGSTNSMVTAEWFSWISAKHNTPHIPVFNGSNRTAVYVSTADDTASSTSTVTLILAELSTSVS